MQATDNTPPTVPPPASPASPADAPLSKHNQRLLRVARKAVSEAADAELAGLMRQNFEEVTGSDYVPDVFKHRLCWETLAAMNRILGTPEPQGEPGAATVQTARFAVLKVASDADLAKYMRANFSTIVEADNVANQTRTQFAAKTLADIVVIRSSED